MSVSAGQIRSHCRRVFSELNNHLVLNRHSKNAKIVKLRVLVEILPEVSYRSQVKRYNAEEITLAGLFALHWNSIQSEIKADFSE